MLWSPVPVPMALKPGAAESPQTPAEGGGGEPQPTTTAAMDEEGEVGDGVDADSSMGEASCCTCDRRQQGDATASRAPITRSVPFLLSIESRHRVAPKGA